MLYSFLLPEGSNGIPCAAQGAAKGAILSRERMAPFRSPKRTQGALPLDPAIVSQALEELLSLRIALRCTWLRHEPLRFVACCNRALLS